MTLITDYDKCDNENFTLTIQIIINKWTGWFELNFSKNIFRIAVTKFPFKRAKLNIYDFKLE